MADQAVFAATNFAVNVLFARWLTPVEFGIFAVSFSVYLLLTVLHFGAVLEPILVQSAKIEPNRRRSYMAALITAHILMFAGITVLAGIGFAVSLFLGAPNAGWVIIGAAVGGSLMVTLLTARRLCLVFLSTRVSATIGIAYALGVITTALLIHTLDHASWFDVWLVMGGWSFVCSAIIFGMLYASLDGTVPYSLGELCRFQWQYARYGVAAAVCSWFRIDGVTLLLAHIAGLGVVAETRAVMNIGNPATQVNLALATSWLVVFSRDHSWPRLWWTAVVYGFAAALGLAAVYELAHWLVQTAYGGRYTQAAWLLVLYCAAVALNGIEAVFTCYMKAIRYLKRGYAPQILGSLTSIGLAYLLIPSLEGAGAVYAILASSVIAASLAIFLAAGRHIATP
jgi:O-antigen/teichoic acid export membrane protein